MTKASMGASTYIGQVASVQGGLVRVRLGDEPSTLVMVAGESYRIGQVGSFVRIPLGYTQLYGVCTHLGADAAPGQSPEVGLTLLDAEEQPRLEGFRWLSVALFGESVGRRFDRGVGQYPTVGDAVHLVTPADLDVIYGGRGEYGDSITIGRIAGSTGIPARLTLSSLVSRHTCVVGSTGAGKSNLVAVVLEALTDGGFPSARVLVIDPHGEYATAVGRHGRIIGAGGAGGNGVMLRVPYWALPFDELIAMTMGDMQPGSLEAIRDRVREMKLQAAGHLPEPPPAETITADSPVPFSIRRLWFELAEDEAVTYSDSSKQDDTTREPPLEPGDAATLVPRRYPPPTSVNTPPYPNRKRRNLGRQLDLLRGRLLDSRFAFLFDPNDPLHPDVDGRIGSDLDATLAQWVGGEQLVTVLDVSAVPPEVLGPVVGTMLRLIYDALFWAMDLPVGGREQPLMVVIDEAHQFLPEGADTAAQWTVSRIAKEGRKYGVGLFIVTQRPSDIHAGVLSQCGTMVALRVTNPEDRRAVSATVPDDLGGLAALLPSLRTGEALVLGDALQVPSRVRLRRARSKPIGDDPPLPAAWRRAERPDAALYRDAVRNWRAGSTSASTVKPEEKRDEQP